MKDNLISINDTHHILPQPVTQPVQPILKERCIDKYCKKIECFAPMICYILIIMLIASLTWWNYENSDN